jgi:hypothetical protein
LGILPIFQYGFFVLGVKGSLNVLLEFAVLLYAENSHGVISHAQRWRSAAPAFGSRLQRLVSLALARS